MTATFGDFLDAADAHIGHACRHRELPAHSARVVVRQLDALVEALRRYLADLTTKSKDAAAEETGPAQAAQQLRLALFQTRPAFPPGADVAPIPVSSTDPVAAHLSAAATSLTVGRDLLQTHLRPGPAGTWLAASQWAPVVTARSVTGALLSEISGFSDRLARWTAQLSLSGAPDPAAAHALNTVSRGLWHAAASLRAAQRSHPLTGAGRVLLRAIPVNAAPPRHPPPDGASVRMLCTGAVTTAERLRYLARPIPATAQVLITAASWQRTAQAAAIVGHASELILRSLAGHAAMDPALTGALRGTADELAQTWLTARAAARQWDPITAGTGGPLTAAAAEASDLVLWTGRIAYRDPAWSPARRHTSALRSPAELAEGQDGAQHVVAAVHHATDATTCLLAADREAIRTAAVRRQLFIPTRLLPDGYDFPYRYAPAAGETIDGLLSSYDAAIRHATRAVAALDNVAIETNAPSTILAMARTAVEGMAPAPRQVPSAARPTARPRAAGVVQRRLRELGISDPDMLLRAAGIDEAINELIAEAETISRLQDIATRGTGGGHGLSQAGCDAAQLAAKDSPASALRLDQPGGNPVTLSNGQVDRHGPAARQNDPRRRVSRGP